MQCFCRTFYLGLLHPSLVCICIVANPMKSFHTEGGRRREGERGEERGRRGSDEGIDGERKGGWQEKGKR